MRNVYLAQVNNQYGKNVFLPYSVGLLQAYAQKIPAVQEHYRFKKLFFLKSPIAQVCKELEDPKVFGFSNYIWNFEYNRVLAEQVKKQFPNTLVVFGGPHVPNRSQEFFIENPFVDILVHGEGEVAFSEILLETVKPNPQYQNIRGLSLKGQDQTTLQTVPRPRFLDLEKIPSPYLTGVFDELIHEEYDFHASQETHRGCPYTCAFCDWGSSTMSKVRPFSDDRLVAELQWFAQRKIDLLYNCDANYGLFPRDNQLTVKMTEIKKKYGFPRKFRAAYAKNSSVKIFEIAKILNDADMCKGVTLSFQSMDENTLQTIRRSNIRIDNFRELLQKYRAQNIPTYTEVILGLPGETYESFTQGLDSLIEAGQHESLNIYACAILPNAELGNPQTRQLHEIQTVRIPVLQHHSTPQKSGITEYSDIVIGTKSMSSNDWKRAFLFSWAIQTFHCLGITQHLAIFFRKEKGLSYKKFYETLIEYIENNLNTALGAELKRVNQMLANLSESSGFEMILNDFGDIIWPPEEASFLNLIRNKDELRNEIAQFAKHLSRESGERDQLKELLDYQFGLIVGPHDPPKVELLQNYDFHSYFLAAYSDHNTSLLKKFPFKIRIEAARLYHGNLPLYAQEVVWYGRKTGQFRHTNVSIEALSAVLKAPRGREDVGCATH